MERIDFLDVKISKQDNRLLTDVFVKSTNTHQYIHATCCHVYHSKKKTYLMTRFCILTKFARKIKFLIGRVMIPLVWIKYRGYNELMRQQILKARKYRRTELLYSQIEEVYNNKLVLNITYYSVFFKI